MRPGSLLGGVLALVAVAAVSLWLTRLADSFTVDFDYRDTPGRGLEILRSETAAIDGVLEDPAVAAYITSIAGGTVSAEVHFWVETRVSSKMTLTSHVLEACRAALTDAGYAVRSEWAARLEVEGRPATPLWCIGPS